jgi:large subunit ribosomal protein L10
MKKTEKNIAILDLTERIKRAKTIVLVDYRGLTVPQISTLRSSLKSVGGEITVAKNTLMKIALKNADVKTENLDLLDLQGPTATIFAYDDEISPIKAIFEFAKINTIPVFKSGLMADKLLTKDDLETLAKLPSKAQLVGKFISLLASPTYRLVSVLKGNQTKLVYILKAQVNKGGEN